MIRLHLWSSPRNISTALMYSFAQRKDTTVVDEPLYAHYLVNQKTSADHPGRDAILSSQENNGNKVIDHLLTHDYPGKLVVFKQMTHHLVNLSSDFNSLDPDVSGVALFNGKSNVPGSVKNVLLIRDPRAILASFSKVVDEVTAADIGLPQQYDLYRQLKKMGALTAVVDARKLLLDPSTQLKKLCAKIGVPFQPSMLNWSPGARPEDGVWAQYWYENVHQSTSFQPYTEKKIHLSAQLEKVAEKCIPPYEELLAASI